MEIILSIIVIVFGVLQIILFFKMWGMTNNVADIKQILENQNTQQVVLIDDIVEGWANNITSEEMDEARKLMSKLNKDHVIAYVKSKKRMEIWTLSFWEDEKNNPDYRLIYIKK